MTLPLTFDDSVLADRCMGALYGFTLGAAWGTDDAAWLAGIHIGAEKPYDDVHALVRAAHHGVKDRDPGASPAECAAAASLAAALSVTIDGANPSAAWHAAISAARLSDSVWSEGIDDPTVAFIGDGARLAASLEAYHSLVATIGYRPTHAFRGALTAAGNTPTATVPMIIALATTSPNAWSAIRLAADAENTNSALAPAVGALAGARFGHRSFPEDLRNDPRLPSNDLTAAAAELAEQRTATALRLAA